ncbi:glycolate oxidase subunit GlcF [Mangrovicoccus algicola]|uniref:Glycolate oxidase iron-sulfur subunit n=1 Tax=Mangrovicoccus algicola TaxID=2771008 RepID=A0A8J6Z9B6_9RHOB|nr:glycolate oxidase subunit GlcF [Mangrovicoccus algicola]MBE3638351.1 glycolate oxidase subunit GlcF [Mangrovicoccus algicola]
MQTNFTEDQLRDPGLARANEILRACVHCGFCTATCPSYQVLGDELDSPRGRIYLIKDMLESGRPADAETVTHIDRCLGCLACMTTCPSGVHYMHLLDRARVHIEKTWKRPWRDRMLRGALARILPYPGRFRLALLGAKLARPLRRLVPDARARAMLDMAGAPIAAPSRLDEPQVHPACGSRRGRVVLMTGCAQKALDGDINAATIRLLTRLGIEVVIPRGEGCCGALVHHMGRETEAHRFAAANIRAWTGAGAEIDAIIVNTSGCGTTVKDYGHMFRNDPLAAPAAEVSAKARDITEYLAALDLPAPERRGLRVGYHAACSLQHGQKVTEAPRRLLAAAGYEVSTPADAHLCCGSAGTYNLMQPAIAAELGRRKAATLEALRPQVIAAGNIGCMTQIGARAGVPVVHTVELLDWAWGGPEPAKLRRA